MSQLTSPKVPVSNWRSVGLREVQFRLLQVDHYSASWTGSCIVNLDPLCECRNKRHRSGRRPSPGPLIRWDTNHRFVRSSFSARETSVDAKPP